MSFRGQRNTNFRVQRSKVKKKRGVGLKVVSGKGLKVKGQNSKVKKRRVDEIDQ